MKNLFFSFPFSPFTINFINFIDINGKLIKILALSLLKMHSRDYTNRK